MGKHYFILGGRRLLFMSLLSLLSGTLAHAYDVRDYEEDAGISISIVRDPGGDVYGGGFESGVWLVGAPLFGELFGHWLVNRLQDGNYYSVGMTIRLKPRTPVAPFVGGGGSYNGLTSNRSRGSSSNEFFRDPDSSYWKGHAEAGVRLWYGGGAQFIEGGYRRHWTDSGRSFNYDWWFLEFGQSF